MANDWCKKTTWSDTDQADFYAHLKRRGDKAPYLSTQAGVLEETGNPELLKAAIRLWDELVAELSAEVFQKPPAAAAAFYRKATCHLKLGELENAIASYRRVLAIERETCRASTNAFLDFGKLVAEENLSQYFDEVLVSIETALNQRGTPFPNDIFIAFGIRAIIAAQQGHCEKAKEFAAIASEAAGKVHSGLHYHPAAGLVTDKDSTFFRSIQQIENNFTIR